MLGNQQISTTIFFLYIYTSPRIKFKIRQKKTRQIRMKSVRILFKRDKTIHIEKLDRYN
jgi:hypothetical protein